MNEQKNNCGRGLNARRAPGEPFNDKERADTIAAIREGLQDAESGRIVPARLALRSIAAKYGIAERDA